MNPRKLLVAGALSALSLPAHARPTVDTCRVTGNVVSQGKTEMCRLAEEVFVAIDGATVQRTDTGCAADGERVKHDRVCRIELPDGRKQDVAVPEVPAPGSAPVEVSAPPSDT